MAADELRRIQRTTLVLGVAATATSGLVWGARGMLASAVGAAVAMANFWALRRLGARAIARATAGASMGQASALAAGLLAKMVLLFALIWVVMTKFGLSAMPLGLGFSAVVIAILLAGVGSQKPAPSAPSPAGSGSPE